MGSRVGPRRREIGVRAFAAPGIHEDELIFVG
jgi:hypothetical protein